VLVLLVLRGFKELEEVPADDVISGHCASLRDALNSRA